MVGSLLIKYRKLQLQETECGVIGRAILLKASGDEDEEDEDKTQENNNDDNATMQLDDNDHCQDNQSKTITKKHNKHSNSLESDLDEDINDNLGNHNGEEVDKVSNQAEDLVDSDRDIDNIKAKFDNSLSENTNDKMSIGDLDQNSHNSKSKKSCEVEDDESKTVEMNGDSEGKENCNTTEMGPALTEADVEKALKRELKEAVEIRIPKVRSKKDINDYKWIDSANGNHTKERSETPPLQKLMRQDFSPLKIGKHSPSQLKKSREHSTHKEGFTSKLASVIVPSVSVPLRTASHPKQLLSHSLASIRSSSLKPVNFHKHSQSSGSLPSRHFQTSKQLFQSQITDEQPLDLSKKPCKESIKDKKHLNSTNSSHNSNLKLDSEKYLHKHENGISSSSTSLQSLEQKFGGDFHLRGLRKPTNYMLFGPEIPALHQALLHSASMSLPHQSLPMSNGASKLMPDLYQNYRYRNSSPSPSSKARLEDNTKSVKRESESALEKSVKREKLEKIEKAEAELGVSVDADAEQNEKYTNHMCTCGKWFDSLYFLSLHLQETGHLPARTKSVSLLEYPKLVRGQDMWLNQESEQTRRILRCIQCGESFRTLPMLTVHMMKTQHYTKIVSSEHARRAHKCSTYCDKEQDKECVFKCRVCQDSFSDMEGLANHMIMSGHHKKQSTRVPQTFGDLQYRHKRKRLYSFEDSLSHYGNPALAAMLEYKRKYMPGQVSPDLSIENEDSDDTDSSTINCENCGKQIETKLFVEHVRACLGQKLAEDIRRDIEKASKDAKERIEIKKREDRLKEERENMTPSPSKKRKQEADDHSQISNCEESNNEQKSKSQKLETKEKTYSKADSSESDNHTRFDSLNNTNKSTLQNEEDSANECIKQDNKMEFDSNKRNEIHSPMNHTSSLDHNGTDTNDENEKLISETQENKSVKTKTTITLENSNSKKTAANFLSKKLDIIDPDNMKEEGSGGSALSAMESFINKSFSNKFDYKKGNIIISPHANMDTTVHSRPLASAMNMDSMDYLSKYTQFYHALNLPNGFSPELMDMENRLAKVDKKTKNGENEVSIKKERKYVTSSPKAHTIEKEDGRASVKSCQSDSSASLDNNENLEKKYLNMSEIEDEPYKEVKKDNKTSALDNLSSFVYGQPLTSEHPLDSLQRLITKADIPKLMSTHGARAFKYLPPHLKLHTNSDLTVPLNLSVKSPTNPDSDDDDDRHVTNPVEESLSDYEAACSPANSDGEPMEYKCAACSRKFASKGSYRYHLSRCHLSSVKRYGIKDAFNMSPYVYLPLDHTAKFSKYYEMARELANKRK